MKTVREFPRLHARASTGKLKFWETAVLRDGDGHFRRPDWD